MLKYQAYIMTNIGNIRSTVIAKKKPTPAQKKTKAGKSKKKK